MSEISQTFTNHLNQAQLSVSLATCYNCSTCATTCPVGLITEGEFNPRTIVLLADNDFKNHLLDDLKPNIWDCAMCELCQEKCPQNVNLHEIFLALKNTLALYDKIPAGYTDEVKQIYTYGKSIPEQTAVMRRREQLGLPKIDPISISDVQTLLNLTNIPKILKVDAEKTEKKDNE